MTEQLAGLAAALVENIEAIRKPEGLLGSLPEDLAKIRDLGCQVHQLAEIEAYHEKHKVVLPKLFPPEQILAKSTCEGPSRLTDPTKTSEVLIDMLDQMSFAKAKRFVDNLNAFAPGEALFHAEGFRP